MTESKQKTYDQINDASNYLKRLTLFQSVEVGIAAAISSSVINHPFQVLRARFQTHSALKLTHPLKELPSIFPKNPYTLFRGFSATFLSMSCLTVTQSFFKYMLEGKVSVGISGEIFTAVFAGFVSAVLTTPLEGAILRQNKVLSESKSEVKKGVFKDSKEFYYQHGLRRLYAGCFLIGVRSAIVGSGFSFWVPILSTYLENKNVPKNSAVLSSAALVGTLFSALSQPPESLRIEQQFSADAKSPLNVKQAFSHLTLKDGLKGLFKGGAYRIPRTAPGIFINAVVYKTLEEYFFEQNTVDARLTKTY